MPLARCSSNVVDGDAQIDAAIRHYPPLVTVPFPLLREALWQLSLEPDEQRKSLHGMVVTDELALDLDNAVTSLAYASDQAGRTLSEGVVVALTELNQLLSAPPEDELWDSESLDTHPSWARARARALSRRLLPLLPQGG